METFSALLAICAGNSPVTGEFHAQRPATRSFDVFFDLRLNKRLSKQSWGWRFETPGDLRRHRAHYDVTVMYISHWAARVNSQNRPHFEGDYRNWWLTRALLDAIQLAASRRNMQKHLCKLERDTTKFDIFFRLGRPSQKIFVWLLLGPYARAYVSLGLTSSYISNQHSQNFPLFRNFPSSINVFKT